MERLRKGRHLIAQKKSVLEEVETEKIVGMT
jgi:hypothetical protein